MDLLTLLFLGIGLAMDCFAVSLAAGISLRDNRLRAAVIVALSFGGFQAFMTIAGWALGDRFSPLITGLDHWVAFILLLIIGTKMVAEAILEKDKGEEPDILHPLSLLFLSVATSIDALAVGISLAFLQADIIPAAAIIGGVSFLFAFGGVLGGKRLYGILGRKTEIAGGLILILIGTRILLEHLGAV